MPAVLYNREKRVLEFVSQYIQRNGYAPTLTEIATGIDVSAVSTVHEHLEKLIQKGFVKKSKGFERSIEIVRQVKKDDKEAAMELPVLGFIAAGAPLEPHTDPNFYMSVSASMLSNKRPGYILQVKGESMVEEGILDGDYIVIQHQEEAQNGDIVVAILPNGFATVKKIKFEKERIKLEPANSSMAPIYTSHVKIQGKVIGVVRKY